MKGGPPTGKLARGAIAAVALGHAGLARAGHGVRALVHSGGAAEARIEHEAELGRILFRALNGLKGTALKLSQMLSNYAEFLPAGVRRELAAACYRVTPLNRALVIKAFRQEFGCGTEALFAQFEPEAFAAASLGQVHRATLPDGTAVAVKLQYPGIAASIASDLQMLRLLLRAMGPGSVPLPPPAIVDAMMDEIVHKLAEELDYEHEAAELTWFREQVTLPPALRDIVIPAPIPSYSGRRVLTMQRLEGQHLDDWLADNPDQAARNHFGQLLFDWFCFSVFELGRINADPHPGNFLFMADGRLGLIDFGCTRTLAPGFGASLAALWKAILQLSEEGSHARLKQAYVALGYLSADLSQEDFDTLLLPALTPTAQWLLTPLRSATFDFSAMPALPPIDSEHARTVGRTMSRFMVGMAPDAPYVDRAYIGTVQMLKQLGAVVVTRNRWLDLH